MKSVNLGRKYRELQGTPLTRFISDSAMNFASFLFKHASVRASTYVIDLDGEIEHKDFYCEVLEDICDVHPCPIKQLCVNAGFTKK